MKCVLLIVVLLLISLACAPVAPPSPPDPIAPLSQSGEPEPDSTSTPEPERDAEPDGTKATAPPKPTRGPEPTKPPEAKDIPAPSPEPTSAPRVLTPPHPNGLMGCQKVRLYADDGSMQYTAWCMEELVLHVRESCRTEPTTTRQRECGDAIVTSYHSYAFRHGQIRCDGIEEKSERRACAEQDAQERDKTYLLLGESWEKVRIGGDRDPEVVKVKEATIECVEGKGFKTNPDLMFRWQLPGTPEQQEKRATFTRAEEKLRNRLAEPTKVCAKQEGLFTHQSRAWLAELRRLEKEEPDIARPLILEGFGDTLIKPDGPAFITGDVSSWLP